MNLKKVLVIPLTIHSSWRPYVILSAAMSLDGHITTTKGDASLSNSADWQQVHELRMKSDAILVGGGTVRSDNPKLTVDENKLGKPVIRQPLRVVVTASGNIPLDARVITHNPEVPTVIAITTQCSFDRQKSLERTLGSDSIIVCGTGASVDLKLLLQKLKSDYAVNTLMVEGGSLINGSFLQQQLIDEIRLAIAPVISGGGVRLFTLPHNTSLPHFSLSPNFVVQSQTILEGMIVLYLTIRYF